jgi:hypothetical protein
LPLRKNHRGNQTVVVDGHILSLKENPTIQHDATYLPGQYGGRICGCRFPWKHASHGFVPIHCNSLSAHPTADPPKYEEEESLML